ncbi:hypothetical protein [Amycolatopsis taiwanensis]|uniref:Extradiol ring-cleavage dioxygenase LigAB LigA subunit domain-containing protein n=1 Tax=Amycolatopsis taiwanensis TaxID=342230 RepID=A0A9W6VLB7_9PSEU|nr:hypothetical protein [Amycolatopsis taiwanensis]GLY70356.1 hypothetical protein Atai01_69750 [Amycolatopsis taiwanensis]
MYALQKLLWDVRKDPALAERFRAEADAVLDEYGIEGAERAAMRSLDFKTLYERGANPYLLYFCALQIGVDRADYYARLRGEAS